MGERSLSHSLWPILVIIQMISVLFGQFTPGLLLGLGFALLGLAGWHDFFV